jgi:DNA-binding LytR/AlgR family response regulator
MQIETVIVEDEPLAQERIRGYVEMLPFLRLAAVFDNAIDALAYLQANEVGLLFLDINLGDFSGIQLLESIKISSEVVISSAYDQYAIKGFELRVTDYLLKPYTFERWLQAVDRVRENLAVRDRLPGVGGDGRQVAAAVERKYVFIRTEHRLEKLLLDDLLYIEGRRDYRRIQAVGRQIMTLATFSDLERAIPPGIAFRIHKSYMVALARIDSVEKDVVRIGQTFIPVSETYKKAFLQAIGLSNAGGH